MGDFRPRVFFYILSWLLQTSCCCKGSSSQAVLSKRKNRARWKETGWLSRCFSDFFFFFKGNAYWTHERLRGWEMPRQLRSTWERLTVPCLCRSGWARQPLPTALLSRLTRAPGKSQLPVSSPAKDSFSPGEGCPGLWCLLCRAHLGLV